MTRRRWHAHWDLRSSLPRPANDRRREGWGAEPYTYRSAGERVFDWLVIAFASGFIVGALAVAWVALSR